MKKVLSFCVFSVLLAMLCLGVKAQAPSGLQMTPANLPTPIVLNQPDTVYLSPTGCFELLGLNDLDSISIEWAILRNGDTIPRAELERYFNEFRFQTKYLIGDSQQNGWWGDSYLSPYCYDGNGWGSFPGAYTPTYGLELGQTCERDGHFNIQIPRHNNPYEFDFFFVQFFKDTINTGHRVIYDLKQDGDYQFVFQIWKRGCWYDRINEDLYTCGTAWNNFKMRDENGNIIESGRDIASGVPYIGGHETRRYMLVSSDTLRQIREDSIPDVYICDGDTYWAGNPAVAYTTTGDYSAYYYGVSSCGDAIDSIINFHLQVETPGIPVLDTLACSNLAFCDSAEVTLVAIPQAVSALTGTCIWFNAAGDSLYTGREFTFTAYESATYKVISYNPESECSGDTLSVYIDKFDSPEPVVTVDTNAQCLNGSFTFTLDQAYDYFVWFHNGDTLNQTATAFDINPAQLTDAGAYYVNAVDSNDQRYFDVKLGCPATSNEVSVEVYTLPEVALISLDGRPYSDTTFCPDGQSHFAEYEVTNGTPAYTLTWANTTATHDAIDDTHFTSTITPTTDCDVDYNDALTLVVDAHNCEWRGNLEYQFEINDTIEPVITMFRRDTNALPAYDATVACQYLVPDVHALIESTTDNCTTLDPLTAVQTPAAGELMDETTTVYLTISDSCGNTTTDSVIVTIDYIPVSFAADTTAQVRCAGECNAEITVTVSNGHAPYDVTLTQGTTTYTLHSSESAFVFPGLCEGYWNIHVVDSNGCTYPDTILNVSSPEILRMEMLDSANLLCHNDFSGMFRFSVNGGRMPITVTITKDGAAFAEWQANASIDTTFNGLTAALYEISVVDDSACMVADSIRLTEPDTLIITNTIMTAVSCYGFNDGTATVTVMGGTPYDGTVKHNTTNWYDYEWIDLATTNVVSNDSVAANLFAGTYRVYVTDANGCIDSADITVTQPDTLAVTEVIASNPDATCPRLASYEFTATTNGGGTPVYTYTWRVNGTAEQTTNSNTATTDTYNHVPSVISCDTTLTVVFEVTDTNNCFASGQTTLRILDDQHPIVEGVLADSTIDGCDSTARFAAATTAAELEALGLNISDNCTADSLLVITSVDNAHGTSCPTIVERTYTVADQCGNDTTFSYNIIIRDIEKPTFVAPNDLTISKDSMCQFNADPAITGTATELQDNCTPLGTLLSNLKYEDDTTAGACQGELVINRMWTLTDQCQNEADTAYQIITIADDMAPWFTNIRAFDTVACDGQGNTLALNLFLNSVRAKDNCTATVEITNELVDSVPGCNMSDYTLIYKFSAKDDCGNQTDSIAKFTVIDTVKPMFTHTAANILAECDTITDVNAIIASWSSQVEYGDGCVAHDSVTLTDSIHFDPGCGHTGVYTKFWTLTDGCNTNVDSATLTIRDIGNPSIYPIPADTTTDCDGAGNKAQFMAWLLAPQASDNCGDATMRYYYRLLSTGDQKYEFDPNNIAWNAEGYFAEALQPDTIPCAVFYEILWEAEDECGNISTTRERFSIRDMSAPEIMNVPNDTAVQCGDDAAISAALNTWLNQVYAVDLCGHDTLHVVPSLTDRLGNPVAGVINNWSPATAVSDCGPEARHWDVQWTASDGICENTSLVQRRFSIIDTVAPVVVNVTGGNTVLADTFYIDRTCDIPEQFATSYSVAYVEANRLAGIDHFIDCSLRPTDLVYHYPMMSLNTDLTDGCSVVYNAKYELQDECGNTLVMPTLTVFVDTLPPMYDNDITETIYMTDNCVKPEVTIFNTVAEMNAHASHPNITDCNLDLTSAAIEFLTHADTVALSCGFTVTRNYKLQDVCGNDTIIKHIITILDNISPVVSGTMPVDTVYIGLDCEVAAADSNAVYANFVDVATLLAAYPELSIEDCSSMQITRGASNVATGDCPEKVITTTFTVTDACDNSTDFIHTLAVMDNTKPALPATALRIDTIVLNDDCTYDIPAGASWQTYADVQAWDPTYEVVDCHVDADSRVNACGGDTAALACSFEAHYYYTVEDDCGNKSDTITLTVVIEDHTAPAISAATIENDTVYVNADCSYDAVALIATATELAGEGITVTDCNLDMDANRVRLAELDTTSVGEMDCHRIVTRKYVVDDNCTPANVSDTIVHQIHLIDNVGPIVSGEVFPVYVSLDPVTCEGPSVDTIKRVTDLPKATSLSDVEIVDCNINGNSRINLVSSDTSLTHCPMIVTRTYNVEDACGNISANTFTQTIVIEDIDAPTITGIVPDSTIYMKDVADGCELPAVVPFATVAELPSEITIFDCNLDENLTLEYADTVYQSAQRPNVIMIHRVYTTTDSCANTAYFDHFIYVQDTFAPIVNTDYEYVDGDVTLPMVQDSIVYPGEDCVIPQVGYISWENHLAYPGMNSIVDCQLIEEISLESEVGPTGAGSAAGFNCVDTIVRTYTVMDSSYNESQFVQLIIVKDTVHPVVNGTLAEATVYTDSTCDINASLNELDTLNATNMITPTFTIEDCHDWAITNVLDGAPIINGEDCADNYLIRYFTISDACGNDTIIEQRINIMDTIKPWLSAPIADQPADAPGACRYLVPDLSALVSAAFVDNCSTDTLSYRQSPVAGTDLTSQSEAVTVYFSDSCGNESMSTVVVFRPDTLNWDRTNMRVDSVQCNGDANGAIHIALVGGTAPYTVTVDGVADNYPDITDLTAGTYNVVVTDADGCSIDSMVVVSEPAKLNVALTQFTDVCQYDDADIYAQINAVDTGSKPYVYEFSLATTTDTTVDFTSSATTSCIMEYLHTCDTIGEFAYIVKVTDRRGCEAFDTVRYNVNPTYYYEDSIRLCIDSSYKWVGHFRGRTNGNDTIYGSEFAEPNRVYYVFDSLKTDKGCDSVYRMKVTYSSLPYLTIRHIGEPESALAETDLYDTYQTGNVTHYSPGQTEGIGSSTHYIYHLFSNQNVGYEIFVQRNCTQCSEDLKVTIDYDIYKWNPMLNGGQGGYEMYTNGVDHDFRVYFSAYWDQFWLGERLATEGTVSTPIFYPSLSAGPGAGAHLDYYNLCWLAPEYEHYQNDPTFDPQNYFGTYYNYGRAHVVDFSQFNVPGQYKIVAKLQERSGSASPWHYMGYDYADGEVGGHGLNIGLNDTVYSGVTMYFTVEEGTTPSAPIVNPMDGIVAGPVMQEVVPTAVVYPNPATDYVTIALTGFEGETSIQLSSSNAKTLSTQVVDIPDASTTQIIKISTSDYAQGVYMLTARNKDVIVTKRVVIVR